MARQGVHRHLGTETLAVADIAPVGAAGDRRVMTLFGPVDARGALHQTAMTAEIDLQAPRGAVRLVDEFEGIPAAEIAKIGVHALWSGEESGNHDRLHSVNNSLHIRAYRRIPIVPALRRRCLRIGGADRHPAAGLTAGSHCA